MASNHYNLEARMTRTDTHAPRNFDPAEYREVGYFDNHPEDGGSWMDDGVMETVDGQFDGNYLNRGRCDHCGAGPIRYGVVFLHTPTNTLLVTGTICASRLNLGSRSELQRRNLLETARRRAAKAAWIAESADNAQAAAILEDALVREGQYRDLNAEGRYHEARQIAPNSFLLDVAFKLNRYGSLSDRQVAAVIKSAAKDAEFAAKRQAEADKLALAPALEAGRQLITGTVQSIKWQDNDFGGSLKMLVQLENGNRVWGSVPSSINPDKGDTVSFTAAVQPSNDDPHFGFYSRPTKATCEGKAA